MKLYVYADESGTFDRVHNNIFVYGGIAVAGDERRQDAIRKYLSIERQIHSSDPGRFGDGGELKAARLSMKERHRLYKATGTMGVRFAAIVDQRRVYESIYDSKQSKQRFLDYALKRAVRSCVEGAFGKGLVRREDINAMSVVVDEHSSSTSGKYNLAASIDEEFRTGMYSFPGPTSTFHEPVFSTDFPKVTVAYVDSRTVPLVRAADVIANWTYCAERDKDESPEALRKLAEECIVLRLP